MSTVKTNNTQGDFIGSVARECLRRGQKSSPSPPPRHASRDRHTRTWPHTHTLPTPSSKGFAPTFHFRTHHPRLTAREAGLLYFLPTGAPKRLRLGALPPGILRQIHILFLCNDTAAPTHRHTNRPRTCELAPKKPYIPNPLYACFFGDKIFPSPSLFPLPFEVHIDLHHNNPHPSTPILRAK